MTTTYKQLTVLIPTPQHDRLTQLARSLTLQEGRCITKSILVREIIDRFLSGDKPPSIEELAATVSER